MPFRVLIVDDEPDLASLMCAFLADMNCAPEAVHEAEAAYAWCRKQAPDLVFLDMHLGDQEGLAVFRQLRALVPRVPVVVISGMDGEDDLAASGIQQPHLFLQKPFGPVEIKAALDRLLPPASQSKAHGAGG